jgi:hypothetical protein
MDSWTLQNVFGLSLSEILIIVMIAVLIAGPLIWTVRLASRTGRSAAGWGIAAVLFGPLALIVLYALSWNDLKEAARGKNGF